MNKEKTSRDTHTISCGGGGLGEERGRKGERGRERERERERERVYYREKESQLHCELRGDQWFPCVSVSQPISHHSVQTRPWFSAVL